MDWLNRPTENKSRHQTDGDIQGLSIYWLYYHRIKAVYTRTYLFINRFTVKEPLNMTNLTQTLLEIRSRFNESEQIAIQAKNDQKTEEMNRLIDEYNYLLTHTSKTLQRAGIIKSQRQFSKLIKTPNFIPDTCSKRLKPQLADITHIQFYISNVLTNINDLLDEFCDKQNIINTLDRLSRRYSELYVNIQKLYLI